MYQQEILILAIIGAISTWTASVIAVVLWLSKKFRDLEKLIYREMNKHEEQDNKQFWRLGIRVQRLELKIFGFTQTGEPISPPEQ